MNQTALLSRGNAIVEHIGDEAAIIDLSTHRVSSLNPAGAALWDHLSEPRTIAQCADLLATTFAIDRDRALSDVRAFASNLLARGLLVHA